MGLRGGCSCFSVFILGKSWKGPRADVALEKLFPRQIELTQLVRWERQGWGGRGRSEDQVLSLREDGYSEFVDSPGFT